MKYKNLLDLVVLAAGKGSRMKSKTLPKPLHSLNGIPMINYLLNNLPLSNFANKYIVVPDKHDEIRGAVLKSDNTFKYVKQSEPRGTGDALLQALDSLESENIIIVNSDTPMIRTDSVLNLIDSHLKQKSKISILIDTFDFDIPGDYGAITKSKDGKITGISENKNVNETKFREFNVGLYCVNLIWLKKSISKINSHNKELYITDLVGIAANEGFDVNYSFPLSKYESIGINDKYQLSVANKIAFKRKNIDLMRKGVNIIDPDNTYVDYNCDIESDSTIQPGTIVKSNSIIKTNCIIGPNTEISNSLIAKNTIIKKSVVSDSKIGSEVKIGPYSHIRQNSNISNKVYIGTNAEVKKSKIESGTKLGHFCYIGDSMIEKNVNIGAGTVTCNFDGKEKQKTNILKNAFIGSGTMIIAPVIIGQNAVVGAGSVVTKDVGNDQLVYGNPATIKKSL
tara:strand:- start:9810 stop:11165 length:1356 start_codon:yes stop_codon:yes gene_type:complete